MIRNAARRITPRIAIEQSLRDVYGRRDRICPERLQRYYELLRREGNRDNMVAMFDTLWRYSRHPTLKDDIAKLSVPTLLMWGERDRWVPVSLVDSWKRDVDELEAIVYPGVGHVPMEEIPLRTARDARRFLLPDA